MRTPLPLLLLALFTALPAAAQPQVDTSDVREVRYTRLGAVESDQASFWTGEKAQVGFYLVELEGYPAHAGMLPTGFAMDMDEIKAYTRGRSGLDRFHTISVLWTEPHGFAFRR